MDRKSTDPTHRPKLIVDAYFEESMSRVGFVFESDDGTPIQPQDIIDAVCEYYLLHHKGDFKYSGDDPAH